MVVAVIALASALAIALAWRNAWAPAAGALVGVSIALATGVASVEDAEHAARDLWQPLIVIVGLMTTTACAAELGIFDWLATWIEPRTRGPVRHAFRMVFAMAAVTAALLSNDAAVLLLTPAVVALVKAVYPKRHPKFAAPFAFAVFAAAGVAPLPTGNPMNLVVASRAGIDFNAYAIYMVPVAIVGWLVAYAMLASYFRGVLADEAPALGGKDIPKVPLGGHARIVLAIAGGTIASYPVMAELGAPLWPVAALAALACFVVTCAGGATPAAIARGVSWELIPFLFGVLVLATAVSRAGATELASLYHASPAPLATIGGIAAAGSALINNHPMALIHSHALVGAPDAHVLAALIGGDLGPRLLPIGSLAGLLWMHELRRHDVHVRYRDFAVIGAVVTVPSLIVSIAMLWLVTAF